MFQLISLLIVQIPSQAHVNLDEKLFSLNTRPIKLKMDELQAEQSITIKSVDDISEVMYCLSFNTKCLICKFDKKKCSMWPVHNVSRVKKKKM